MIEKIRKYFIEQNIINDENEINIDFLGPEATKFSINRVPSKEIIEGPFIDGSSTKQFQFQLLSCNYYGSDVLQNIENSNFYDNLCEKISFNNRKHILPSIEGIETIECLTTGAIKLANTNTAKWSMQMRITYYSK